MPLQGPTLDTICYSLEQARTAAGRSRAAIYQDWLSYCAGVLEFHTAVEAIRDRLQTGANLLEAIDLSDVFANTPQGASLRQTYGATEGGSWEATAALFRTALEAALNQITRPIDGRSFVEANNLDLFGLLYQAWVHPGDSLGLTPYSTAQQIAAAIVPDGRTAVVQAIELACQSLERHDAIAAIIARANLKLAQEYNAQGDSGGWERTLVNNLLPMIAANMLPITVADPACGSGTLLLAVSTRFPAFAIEAPLIKFVGFDLDPVCVQMARLNEILYGFNGHFAASVNGTPLPPSMISSSLRLPQMPFVHSVFPAGLFTLVETALTVSDNPDMLRALAADARRLTTAQATALAAGRLP